MKIFLRYFSLSFLLIFIPYNFLNAGRCPHCSDLRDDDCLTGRTHGGGSTGKWADEVTPKRGWTCTGAEDLGAGVTEQCQMCEREEVRYIHHMRHGDQQPLNFRVGCICSGHMEGRIDDETLIAQAVANAKRRTADLQNRAARRIEFPTLTKWKISKNNNPYIKNYHGHHIVITRGGGRYSASIDGNYINQWVDTIEQAKLTAFDYLYPTRIN